MTSKRALQPVAALQARREMDASVLASDPTLGVLKVWTVVANYTLGYGRVSDALTHGRIASEAGVTRETVRRAVKWLAQAGIITPPLVLGTPSRAKLFLPYSGDLARGDPSREWGPLRRERRGPLPRVGRPLPSVGTHPSSQRDHSPPASGDRPLWREG